MCGWQLDIHSNYTGRKIMMVITLLLLVFSLPVAAPQEKRQDRAEMLKATQPGEHHKQLESLAGSWDVVVKFKYGPGPERQSKARCEAKWVLGGRFLQQEYENESGQRVLQFFGYDNQKKRFFISKMDNMDTGVLYTEGDISEDGKAITLVGNRTDPLSGKTGRLRIVTTLIDPDHYRVEWYQVGEDAKEERVVAMEHARHKS
jgi:hypothetical protein